MEAILKRTVVAPRVEGKDFEDHYEYKLIEQGNPDRYYPLDGGATVMAVVVLCLTEFARGLGEGLGKEIGTALFGGKSSKEELRDLFESFTRFVLQSIRQEFYANRWREIHEEQAALAIAFNDVLSDTSRRTKNNLLALDLDLLRNFIRLNNLGAGAFAGQLRIGMALIGNSLIYASMYGGAGAYRVSVQRIDTVMKDLEISFGHLQDASKARVQGPNESETIDVCDAGPDFPRSEGEVELLPLDADPARGDRWYKSPSKTYVVTVDDAPPKEFRRFDHCKAKPDRSAQAWADAKTFADAASVPIANEFQELFGLPFAQAKIKARQLREKAEKRAGKS